MKKICILILSCILGVAVVATACDDGSNPTPSYQFKQIEIAAADYDFLLGGEITARQVRIPVLFEHEQLQAKPECTFVKAEGDNIENLQLIVNNVLWTGDLDLKYTLFDIDLIISLTDDSAFTQKKITKLYFKIGDKEVSVAADICIKDRKEYGTCKCLDVFMVPTANTGTIVSSEDAISKESFGIYCNANATINQIRYVSGGMIDHFSFGIYDQQSEEISVREVESNLKIDQAVAKNETFVAMWDFSEPYLSKFFGEEIIIQYSIGANEYVDFIFFGHCSDKAIYQSVKQS